MLFLGTPSLYNAKFQQVKAQVVENQQQKKGIRKVPFLSNGGEWGIQTPDTRKGYTGFRVQRDRSLCQLSIGFRLQRYEEKMKQPKLFKRKFW